MVVSCPLILQRVICCSCPPWVLYLYSSVATGWKQRRLALYNSFMQILETFMHYRSLISRTSSLPMQSIFRGVCIVCEVTRQVSEVSKWQDKFKPKQLQMKFPKNSQDQINSENTRKFPEIQEPKSPAANIYNPQNRKTKISNTQKKIH